MAQETINKKSNKVDMDYQVLKTPIGKLYFMAYQNSLRGILFEEGWSKFVVKNTVHLATYNPLINQAKREIRDYLQGLRFSFSVPCHLAGTEFQNQAWQALSEIPYGKTSTYLDQAKAINRPRAVRAIGSANGKNPISIIYPCHRIINQNGDIGGYGGGIAAKEYLLELEHDFSNKNPRYNNLIFLRPKAQH